MSKNNDDFRDSIEKSREALRDHQDSVAFQEDIRRDAVRAVVNDLRAGGFEQTQRQSDPAAPSLHPFFQGLLDCLPAPGEAWPTRMRDQWLDTARNIFALLYTEGDAEATVAETPRLRLVMRAEQPIEEDQPTPSYNGSYGDARSAISA